MENVTEFNNNGKQSIQITLTTTTIDIKSTI